MNSRILLVTNRADLHADLMAELLTKKGHIPFRINLDEFPKYFEFEYVLRDGKHDASITHLPSGEQLQLANVGAIWGRKKAEFTFVSDDLSHQEYTFAKQEAEHSFNSLLYSLDCFWLNHPLAVRSAIWKGEQSIRAAKMGFKVPDSLISNHPKKAREFILNRKVPSITKAMSSTFLGAESVDYQERIVNGMSTTIVTDELMENIDGIREIPSYFQEYVNKAFELRVTVIGKQVFTAKIHSQEDERTKIDFRNFEADIKYEAFQLPDVIKNRCIEFVQSYQLQYGAIDLIVTPENDYVFLENNPGGQFWFVEQLVPELKILEAVASYLIEGATCKA